MHTLSRSSLAAALFLVLSTWNADAFAFAEDICYVPNQGGLANCTPLPAACKAPFPNESPQCLAAAAATFVQQNALYPDGGRSTLHTDVTHLMAQVVGFNANDAYWIAAYDEAADLGSFEPRDLSGAVVGGGTLATVSIAGISRNNFPDGGVLFHFGPPRTDGGPVNGLHPDVDDADTEVFLSHLRRWAFAGSGTSPPLCTASVTNRSSAGDYATGTTCYVGPTGQPAAVQGSLSLLGPVPINFVNATGLQVVDGTTTSNAFDQLVGAAAPMARIGIYLHALADRISHHVCLDRSSFTGPSQNGTVFTADMSNADCSQPRHALRHMWEVGVRFSALEPEDRTTEAGLRSIYDELALFAQERGVLPANAGTTRAREALVGDLSRALQEPNARDRVVAITQIACARGLSPFPGAGTCSGS